MAKKTFSAAEKHFQGKEIKYQQEINKLREQRDAHFHEMCEWRNLFNRLTKVNEEQEKTIKKLLEKTGMSEDEVKNAIKVETAINHFLSVGNLLSKHAQYD